MNINYKSIDDFDKLKELSSSIASLKRYNNKIEKEKTIIKNFSIFTFLILAIIVVCFYYYKDFLTAIIISFTIIVLYTLVIVKKTIKISKIKQKKPDKNYIINLPEDTYWNNLINSGQVSSQIKYLNFESNNKIIVINNNLKVTVLTSEFMINILSENIVIVSGEEYVRNMRKIENTALQNEVYNYRYKEFSHEKWRYQRKDGGPDRRYNNNFLYKYYKYKIFSFNGIRVNVPNFFVYDHFKNKFNYNTIKTNVNYFPERQRINSINFKSFESIINYLIEKQIVYNYYGSELEFKINDEVFNVTEKDLKLESYASKLKKIFGGLYYDE